MKKFIFLTTIFFTFMTQVSFSQNLISVQNGSSSSFYTTLDLAISNALDGDTINLPGGSFSFTNTIAKRLHFIGVGINPDSTSATVKTIFSSVYSIFSFENGAEFGSLTGIYFTSSLTFNQVNNYIIDRCLFPALTLSVECTNITVKNCVVGNINGSNSQNNMFISTFIYGQVSNFGINNNFKNNFFSYYIPSFYIPGALFNITGSFISNNIFKQSYNEGWNNNIAKNNINVPNGLFGNGASNFGENNYQVTDIKPLFLNYSGGGYSFTENYHLQNPTQYTGTDATQVGLYGGAFPWKEGSIPFNPHFQTVQIAPTTDSTGNLNVNIKVAAQDR
ncbi:MAG: hypothetical protein FD155_1811 [Bacteroidetes bacterium]|nr:MAG: hypothetical protein FD155_1811 [Bacteroidota bacterium]